uniref:Uncharacterized protein n=1 Tax=Solanum tuberosum TaxID=4113 RepID=M1DLE5_SOLTU
MAKAAPNLSALPQTPWLSPRLVVMTTTRGRLRGVALAKGGKPPSVLDTTLTYTEGTTARESLCEEDFVVHFMSREGARGDDLAKRSCALKREASPNSTRGTTGRGPHLGSWRWSWSLTETIK